VRADVVTIFPEYLAPLSVSLLGKARTAGLLDVRVHDLRDWTHDRHRTVDDTPYGGGPGMVMKPEPWGEALDAVLDDPPAPGARPTLVVPTPSGRPFTQRTAVDLAARPWLVFACGRYEGIDRRVVDDVADSGVDVVELSLGDYVLAGGEVAVLVVVEAVARLLPGVLGNADSAVDDSFADGAMSGLLEGPVFTKPPAWRGREVPDVLRSGDHGAIARWRRHASLRRTAEHRPDLVAALRAADLAPDELALLAELGWAPGPDGRLGPAAPPVAD
jgi:tRNA (guanine37-N1)-methyltransferase